MAEAVLGLGGNLGARCAALRCALGMLAATPGCRLLARSPLYETPPLGPPQPDYLNAAVRVSWEGEPAGLLARTQQIERVLGRERSLHWGPRTLDIDVLYWSEGPLCLPGLVVPHRSLHDRAFALAPLLDVAPERSEEWGARLIALGGAPPRAALGWLGIQEGGAGTLATPWLAHGCELASLLPELIARSVAPSARASHTLAVSGPSALVDAQGDCWLTQRVNEAHAGGFVVAGCAMLHDEGGLLRGVLLGEQHTQARPPASPPPRFEQRADGTRRAVLHCEAPYRGFDFAGSITM